MQTILPTSTTTASLDVSDVHRAVRGSQQDPTSTREAFQDFVAGTFFKQMLKSLRKMHDKPAYFHGGQAEDIFREHLDQQISEDLAREHGAALSEPLYRAFAGRQELSEIDQDSTEPSTATTGSALDLEA